mmetsp:Transcript_8572/g.13961  ORF Transcript_8572/g.13961 Transcript_8572/m.13961 type:complete len:100 (-) Transcript_8572:112-411(-)
MSGLVKWKLHVAGYDTHSSPQIHFHRMILSGHPSKGAVPRFREPSMSPKTFRSCTESSNFTDEIPSCSAALQFSALLSMKRMGAEPTFRLTPSLLKRLK